MTDAPLWFPVVALFALLGLAYLGMWRGWRRRARRHDLPPLAEVPPTPHAAPAAVLEADAQFYGTTVSGDWLDRVVARGLGSRSGCRLVLSAEGLDVHRPSDSFRIPAPALRGARHDQGIAGKVVPPHGVLVVTWQHGDHTLDTGFRLAGRGQHDTWVQTITSMAKESA
jgi:hypothetical protein